MNGHPPPTIPPVDQQELYKALCDACSQDASLLRGSSQSLKMMYEDRFGTYDALQEIASRDEVPLLVRQQALIQFKNNALGHWRSRKLASDEMRERIKARCLAFLNTEDDLLANTNGIIVAKIARSEINNNWPPVLAAELLKIVSTIATSWSSAPDNARAPPALRRSLQLLHALMKEMTSVKMMNGVKLTAQLVSDLSQPLLEYYSVLARQMLSLNPQAMSLARTPEIIMLAQLVFKIQSTMAVWLFPKSNKPGSDFQVLDPWLRNFSQAVAVQLPVICDLRINLARSLPSNVVAARSMELLTRHVLVYGKLFQRLQAQDKRRFSTMPGCAPLVLFYWEKVTEASKASAGFIEDKPTAVYPVRFLTQAMTIFRDNLSCWAPYRRDGNSNEVVLPQNLVEDAAKILIIHFIPLKPSDLEGWKENPESWVNTEEVEGDQLKYELRPCAERVLMVLATQYSQFITPLLADTFTRVAMVRAHDLASLMQKEALYCAVGRCVAQLKDHIPFDSWLETVLLPESRDQDPNYPIIKRRIAWVLSQWISLEAASPQNPRIWDILVHLLQDQGSGADPVVQLTAAIAISKCVDTIAFDLNVFLPFLPTTITELVKMAGEVDDLVTKQRIIKTLNVVIERSGVHITPFIALIAGPVPKLWTDSAEEPDSQWGFKGSLLEAISNLIKAVGDQSTPLQGLVVPLVRESLAPGKPMQNLDEDALTLWLTALLCAVPMPDTPPPLFELFPIAISLLHDNLDLLGKITSIVESYYLLGANTVLQHFALDLFRAYKNSLSQAFATNVKYLLISLELLVQITPSSLWGEAMHVSGLFPYMLQTLFEDKADSLVLSEHVHLFARIAATDRKIFIQLMDAAIASQPIKVTNPQEASWEGLMDQWWNRFDSMSEPRHRKLTAMAMADLIATGQPVVLKRLPGEIFNLWLDVFSEVKEAKNLSDERPDSPLLRYWEQDKAPDYMFGESEGTPEYARREAVWNSDPVRTTQLTAFVASRLQETEMILGGPQALQAVIASADPTVLQQIQKELAVG